MEHKQIEIHHHHHHPRHHRHHSHHQDEGAGNNDARENDDDESRSPISQESALGRLVLTGRSVWGNPLTLSSTNLCDEGHVNHGHHDRNSNHGHQSLYGDPFIIYPICLMKIILILDLMPVPMSSLNMNLMPVY